MPTSVSDYTQVVATYGSKNEAYNDLGVNARVRSHSAKVVKTREEFSILCCKLFNQSPPCTWNAALVRAGDRFELRGRAGGTCPVHNRDSPPLPASSCGYGLESLEVKRALQKTLSSTVSVRPRAAHRAHLLKEKEAGEETDAAQDVSLLEKDAYVDLKQVRGRARTLVHTLLIPLFCCRRRPLS